MKVNQIPFFFIITYIIDLIPSTLVNSQFTELQVSITQINNPYLF